MADMRYVKGLTRYIQIQNLGKLFGGARTPQNMRHIIKSRLAIFPPVSAELHPAIMKSVKVQVKSMKTRKSKNIRAPRSATASVGSALRYRPMG